MRKIKYFDFFIPQFFMLPVFLLLTFISLDSSSIISPS